ncbi:unnamed protein product [Brachionus calyciflorus]|uniref:Uncharacterized protein n=1 Tax=Brachionus calyciflorus TaxID=104777 RepID=A0A814P159_9BILA|nr:unnamed protein product [Brachionus calyciflorus]
MDSNYPYNGRGSGPSGKPDLHFILKNSRADAEEAAKRAGRGQPIHHTAHEPDQYPHFHPADRDGNIIKNGQHFGYPQNTKFHPR